MFINQYFAINSFNPQSSQAGERPPLRRYQFHLYKTITRSNKKVFFVFTGLDLKIIAMKQPSPDIIIPTFTTLFHTISYIYELQINFLPRTLPKAQLLHKFTSLEHGTLFLAVERTRLVPATTFHSGLVALSS